MEVGRGWDASSKACGGVDADARSSVLGNTSPWLAARRLEFPSDVWDDRRMRISKKARHAVRAVLDLAVHDTTGRGARSADIARRSRIPEKFLEAILRDLREAGLVISKRGPDGGHRLAGDPATLSLRVVVEAIDGALFDPPLRSPARPLPEDLALLAFWKRLEGSVADDLASTTIGDLRHEASRPEPLDFSI